MAQTPSEIVVAGGGAVYVAPVGTTAPIDSISTPGAGWQEMGLTTEAGVKFHDAKTVVEIKSWQLFYAGRRIITAREATATFALQQWNKNTTPLAFGGATLSTPIAGGVGTLTNRALTSNVVTLTTSAPHGFGVGQTVVVAGLTGGDAFLNGTYVITAVPTSTTFTFALTHADVVTGATSGSGTATVGAVYKLVPPSAGTLDERACLIDWQDGTKHFRLIIPKGIVQDNVDTELTKSKEAELPIVFGATTVDGGTPWAMLTDAAAAFA